MAYGGNLHLIIHGYSKLKSFLNVWRVVADVTTERSWRQVVSRCPNSGTYLSPNGFVCFVSVWFSGHLDRHGGYVITAKAIYFVCEQLSGKLMVRDYYCTGYQIRKTIKTNKPYLIRVILSKQNSSQNKTSWTRFTTKARIIAAYELWNRNVASHWAP